MPDPIITVAVPSLNQGRFLDKALRSISEQGLPAEVFVLDGGSTDQSVDVIRRWENRLSGWRSRPDRGQAAAINEGIARGRAPYVCWLNADDYYLTRGIETLIRALERAPEAPAAYGCCWTVTSSGRRAFRYPTLRFRPWVLANFCFICQPGTVIRRTAWESVGGLNEDLHVALDYDLWWRLYGAFGALEYTPEFVAAAVMHSETKTATKRREHYLEAMAVVRQHTGRTPLKWYLAWPFMVNAREWIRAWADKFGA